MSGRGSVAPKERVNIVYKSDIGGLKEDVELPFKMLVAGDFTGKESEETLEQKRPIDVNKDNFNEVMKGFGIGLQTNVKNTLSEQDEELSVGLEFDNIRSFGPERIAEQVPELKKLMELRQALRALKGPLGNVPAFRKTLQKLLSDEETRKKITEELGVDKETPE